MDREDIGHCLVALGLSQRQLAGLWEVSPATVSRWCNGKQPIPAWVPYAIIGVEQATSRVDQGLVKAPAEKPKLVKSKPLAAPDVPGRWRFGRFYPD